GTRELNETGQSNLTFHADSPSLEEVGKLVDQPIKGIGKVDGTITGNRSQLQAAGNFTGGDIAYGDTTALTMTGTYTAKVPDLTFEDANLTADTSATFVTVAGQNVNELHAKTDYANKHLAFDATAKQPQRSMGASGSLLLHPDHQEVHLEKLDLMAQNTTWTLLPGGQPTINYAGNKVSVQNLVLASGNQQITAEGEYGRPGG